MGKKNDGGYLVGEETVKKAEALISFGIKNDWSFEKDFRKINNKSKIKCYDNQLNLKLLVRLFIIQLIFVFKNCPWLSDCTIKKLLTKNILNKLNK